jgi:hypothetical protein
MNPPKEVRAKSVPKNPLDEQFKRLRAYNRSKLKSNTQQIKEKEGQIKFIVKEIDDFVSEKVPANSNLK